MKRKRGAVAVFQTPPQRILIVKPSSLGDIATTLPLLCDLRALYPEAQIDWLIAPALADLVRGHEALHELLFFDRGTVDPWWSPAGLGRLWRLQHLLRTRRYDLVLDAQGLLRSGLLARWTGAPVRVGFGWAREGAVHLYTHWSHLPPPPQQAVVRMRSLMGPLGGPPRPVEFRVPISRVAVDALRGWWPTGGGRVAAVIPGARWDSKRWSEDGFAEIGRRLAAAGFGLVLIGSKSEERLCAMIAQRVGQAAVNVAGCTTLAEMIAALSLCDVVIGNDSGPLHVAVALGRPLVGLYGPTDPLEVGPWGQLDHVLRFDDPGNYRAAASADRSGTLARLPAERVWDMVKTVAGI